MQIVSKPTPAVAPVIAGAAARSSMLIGGAAALSLLAAWVHLAYTSSHWRDWWAYGAFFLVTGLGQGLLAAALLRWPRHWTALIGIAGNLAIVGMYVQSRTIGVPLGPHAGVAEQTGAVDLATTGVEIATVALLLALVGSRTRRWIMNLLPLAGALLWAGRLTGYVP
jgi:hypothetical protein